PPVTTARPTTTLEPPTTAPSTTTSNSTADENAVETTVHLPEEAGQAPLVVLIPGGGWHSADPSQLDGLARHLAGAGNVAVTARIRAFVDGVSYPLPSTTSLVRYDRADEKPWNPESISVPSCSSVIRAGHICPPWWRSEPMSSLAKRR